MVLSYKTVKTSAEAEITEKKSRFIANIAPASTEEEALFVITEIKNRYKDASHNCTAYRVGLETVSERRSDDGEPQGTAGIPMLVVLKKENITNAVAVVTRYFGGVLLGHGGLVRAYTASCQAGLSAAGTVTKRLMKNMLVTVDYNLAGRLQHEISAREILLRDTVYGADVTFYAAHPAELAEWAADFYTRLSAGKAVIKTLGFDYL